MVKLVKDLQEKRYALVQDSQDRLVILESIGKPDLMDEYQALLVWEQDGDLVEVWGIPWVVPHLTDRAWRLL
jgi:hypothetical protein